MPLDVIVDFLASFGVPYLHHHLDPSVILAKIEIPIPIPRILLPFLGIGGAGLFGLGAAVLLSNAPSDEPALKEIRPDLAPKPASVDAGAVGPSVGSEETDLSAEVPREIDKPADLTPEPVSVSSFAPAAVPRHEGFYIQVIFHGVGKLEEAAILAESLDAEAKLAKTASLNLPLLAGDDVRVTVESREIEIDSPDQVFKWHGPIAQIAFAARLAKDANAPVFRALVRVFVNSAPAAILKLELKCAREEVLDAVPVAREALRFNKVFLSYASADRPKVLEMAKMLRAQRIDFFQDVLSLEPGERWEQEIYKRIAACDAFYLFWSSAAKNSEWVIREATTALQYQKDSPNDVPWFMPIILEGPPIVSPPPELNGYHFNDPLQYMIYAENAARAATAVSQPP